VAARKVRTTLSRSWRLKIRATQVANRLNDYVLGKIKLSSTQVRAAQIVIDKLASNLIKRTDMMSGGKPMPNVVNVTVVPVTPVNVVPIGERGSEKDQIASGMPSSREGPDTHFEHAINHPATRTRTSGARQPKKPDAHATRWMNRISRYGPLTD
jgi:hypothetical protein